ncbi:MAG: UvrB/UvrC motif-containing protein [Clostridiales bacterium]|nr:UvrB/UvrC motif-containing protein [Clostridiales bacterium]
MLCEDCGLNEANVEIRMFGADGEAVVRHLCQDCAEKLKGSLPQMHAVDISDFLGAILAKIHHFRTEEKEEEFDGVCPECGMSWAEVRKDFNLGCPGCYRAFREPIEEYLVKLNGSAIYAGEAPSDRRTENRDVYRLIKLKESLKAAIGAEDYEQAARLRDEIRTLEKALEGEPSEG